MFVSSFPWKGKNHRFLAFVDFADA